MLSRPTRPNLSTPSRSVSWLLIPISYSDRPLQASALQLLEQALLELLWQLRRSLSARPMRSEDAQVGVGRPPYSVHFQPTEVSRRDSVILCPGDHPPAYGFCQISVRINMIRTGRTRRRRSTGSKAVRLAMTYAIDQLATASALACIRKMNYQSSNLVVAS